MSRCEAIHCASSGIQSTYTVPYGLMVIETSSETFASGQASCNAAVGDEFGRPSRAAREGIIVLLIALISSSVIVYVMRVQVGSGLISRRRKDVVEGPQSEQSVPRSQRSYSEPGRPSSQTASLA